MRIDEYEPLYTLIEPIRIKDPQKYFNTFSAIESIRQMDFTIKPMKWSKFKKKYGACFIYSIRDFEDTQSTSIIFGDVDMGLEPMQSIHELDGTITWRT